MRTYILYSRCEREQIGPDLNSNMGGGATGVSGAADDDDDAGNASTTICTAHVPPLPWQCRFNRVE